MCAAAALCLGGAPAFADDLGGDIALDGFRPALDARGFVTVDGASVLDAGAPSFGLVTTWSRGLLELDSATASYRVEDVMSPTFVAAIGLPFRTELAAALPFGVVASNRDPDTWGDRGQQGAQGLGDATVSAKARVAERGSWSLAAAATLTLPTATRGSWLGSRELAGGGKLIAEWRGDRLRFGVNAGVRQRAGGDTSYTEMMTGETVTLDAATLPLGAALAWQLGDKFDLLGEVGAQVPLGGDVMPVELTGALCVRLAEASHLTIGAGTGLAGGAGNPEVRAFAAILFEPGARHHEAVVIEHDDPPPADPARPGDRDDDKIYDHLDDCPDDREDYDDFEDGDGCPDLDNDRDRIVDVDDLCPDDPEDYDEVDDGDGCPEEDPPKHRVVERDGELVVFEEIFFDFDSARIQERSHDVLRAVAETIRGNPDLRLVEIGGHTDARGSATYNEWLSQQRAESVMTFLVGEGVDEDRLSAMGYGESVPKMKGRSEQAYEANRRVEFMIVKRD